LQASVIVQAVERITNGGEQLQAVNSADLCRVKGADRTCRSDGDALARGGWLTTGLSKSCHEQSSG
jgi:hypothetical protein